MKRMCVRRDEANGCASGERRSSRSSCFSLGEARGRCASNSCRGNGQGEGRGGTACKATRLPRRERPATVAAAVGTRGEGGTGRPPRSSAPVSLKECISAANSRLVACPRARAAPESPGEPRCCKTGLCGKSQFRAQGWVRVRRACRPACAPSARPPRAGAPRAPRRARRGPTRAAPSAPPPGQRDRDEAAVGGAAEGSVAKAEGSF
jgi:hypothetical protein